MLSVPAYRNSQDIKIHYVPIAGSSIDTEARSTASRYQITNILIVESGSAAVTDSGISKRSALNVSHETHERRIYDSRNVSLDVS